MGRRVVGRRVVGRRVVGRRVVGRRVVGRRVVGRRVVGRRVVGRRVVGRRVVGRRVVGRHVVGLMLQFVSNTPWPSPCSMMKLTTFTVHLCSYDATDEPVEGPSYGRLVNHGSDMSATATATWRWCVVGRHVVGLMLQFVSNMPWSSPCSMMKLTTLLFICAVMMLQTSQWKGLLMGDLSTMGATWAQLQQQHEGGVCGKTPYLCLFAMDTIAVGTELLYDYGLPESRLSWRLKVSNNWKLSPSVPITVILTYFIDNYNKNWSSHKCPSHEKCSDLQETT